MNTIYSRIAVVAFAFSVSAAVAMNNDKKAATPLFDTKLEESMAANPAKPAASVLPVEPKSVVTSTQAIGDIATNPANQVSSEAYKEAAKVINPSANSEHFASHLKNESAKIDAANAPVVPAGKEGYFARASNFFGSKKAQLVDWATNFKKQGWSEWSNKEKAAVVIVTAAVVAGITYGAYKVYKAYTAKKPAKKVVPATR